MSEPRPDDSLISGSLKDLIDRVERLEANLCWVFVLASSVWACVVGMMLLGWGLK